MFLVAMLSISLHLAANCCNTWHDHASGQVVDGSTGLFACV
jgi:hypothetical protein